MKKYCKCKSSDFIFAEETHRHISLNEVHCNRCDGLLKLSKDKTYYYRIKK